MVLAHACPPINRIRRFVVFQTWPTAVHCYQEKGLLKVAGACNQPEIDEKRCLSPCKLIKSLVESGGFKLGMVSALK